jgi:hypothetical protein
MNTSQYTRYEVEWPTSPDIDAMEFEFAHFSTLGKARAFALKMAKQAPIGVAYVTKETYEGEGNPFKDERGWEQDINSREEISA